MPLSLEFKFWVSKVDDDEKILAFPILQHDER
jgi:hypothetical protein